MMCLGSGFMEKSALPELGKARSNLCLTCPFSRITEFCLLRGKHGGFEHQRRSDIVFPDAGALQDFPFWDVPDAGQGLPTPDGPLSVLKQGIASRVGHSELMAS